MKNFENRLHHLIDSAKHAHVEGIEDRKTREFVETCMEFADSLNAEKYSAKSLSVKTPGQKVYDDAIKELFEEVDNGLTQEGMMEFLIKKFQPKNRHSISDNPGDFYTNSIVTFWLDSIETQTDGWLQYTGGNCNGVHPQRWDNFKNNYLGQMNDSTLLDWCVRKQNTIELQYVQFLPDYNGEFSSLIDNNENNLKEDFWFSAIPLATNNKSGLARTFILIYSNEGDEQSPQFANGIKHEIRFLKYVALAYRLLKHRDDSFKALFNEKRKELINELGPGILHHELGQSLILLAETIGSLRNNAVKLVASGVEKELTHAISLDVVEALDYVSRSYAVTDSFNNLERKHPTEEFDLADILEQAMTVCRYRLNAAGIYPNFKKESLQHTIYSDAGLLLHLVINILTNASNACEYDTRIDKKLFWFKHIHDDKLSIFIGNNGPRISPEFRDKIFESGYTLRNKNIRRGHGQGLFLCHQIAKYLGGDISLFDGTVFDNEISVCFKITIATRIPKEQLLE